MDTDERQSLDKTDANLLINPFYLFHLWLERFSGAFLGGNKYFPKSDMFGYNFFIVTGEPNGNRFV